jgi:D-beta-D-heptose 7-phosphate kinase/D-beta-D-heptose 1-phosphate adenosyltransferase
MAAGKPKVVLVTGGFDPLHCGHIEYLREASKLGDILVVGVNSDEWLSRKKGRPFMRYEDRSIVVAELKNVSEVIPFDDTDNSAKDALRKVREQYPDHTIVFANGGDRTKSNIPEMDFVDDNIEFVFGVGGETKLNSSSWILEEWKNPKIHRTWGYYRVLDDKGTYKVKELVIDPGKRLSMQRHFNRAEHWYILKGKCDIVTEYRDSIMSHTKRENEEYIIGATVWHQGQNNYNEPCHILEVQYGIECIEEDIERRDA